MPTWGTACPHLLAEGSGASRGQCQMDGGPACFQPRPLLPSLLSAYSEEGAAPGDSSEYLIEMLGVKFDLGLVDDKSY